MRLGPGRVVAGDLDLLGDLDAVVHLDRTRAVEPFDGPQRWSSGEPPETYPSAI